MTYNAWRINVWPIIYVRVKKIVVSTPLFTTTLFLFHLSKGMPYFYFYVVQRGEVHFTNHKNVSDSNNILDSLLIYNKYQSSNVKLHI